MHSKYYYKIANEFEQKIQISEEKLGDCVGKWVRLQSNAIESFSAHALTRQTNVRQTRKMFVFTNQVNVYVFLSALFGF